MPKTTAENTLALAFVVFVNWLLAHLATDWTMPSEVESSLQAGITVLLGAHFQWRDARKTKAEETNQRLLAEQPPVVPVNAAAQGEPHA